MASFFLFKHILMRKTKSLFMGYKKPIDRKSSSFFIRIIRKFQLEDRVLVFHFFHNFILFIALLLFIVQFYFIHLTSERHTTFTS